MQFGDVNALAVEAEPPAKGREQEADHDNAPAVVADRGFVDGGGGGCVQFSVSSLTPSCPGLVPAMTTSMIRSARAKLRQPPNCQQLSSNAGTGHFLDRP